MSNATAVALAKVRAAAIREAMIAVSDDADNHDDEHFGTEYCLGCRWRKALSDYARTVETEADDHV